MAYYAFEYQRLPAFNKANNKYMGKKPVKSKSFIFEILNPTDLT